MWRYGLYRYASVALLVFGVVVLLQAATLWWKPPRKIEPTPRWRLRAALLGLGMVALGFLLRIATGSWSAW